MNPERVYPHPDISEGSDEDGVGHGERSLFGKRAKNFMGSHLGELGGVFVFVVFCFVFDEEEQSLGRGKQDDPCGPLNARLLVASSVVSLKD